MKKAAALCLQRVITHTPPYVRTVFFSVATQPRRVYRIKISQFGYLDLQSNMLNASFHWTRLPNFMARQALRNKLAYVRPDVDKNLLPHHALLGDSANTSTGSMHAVPLPRSFEQGRKITGAEDHGPAGTRIKPIYEEIKGLMVGVSGAKRPRAAFATTAKWTLKYMIGFDSHTKKGLFFPRHTCMLSGIKFLAWTCSRSLRNHRAIKNRNGSSKQPAWLELVGLVIWTLSDRVLSLMEWRFKWGHVSMRAHQIRWGPQCLIRSSSLCALQGDILEDAAQPAARERCMQTTEILSHGRRGRTNSNPISYHLHGWHKLPFC
jgi:hypothetical protein